MPSYSNDFLQSSRDEYEYLSPESRYSNDYLQGFHDGYENLLQEQESAPTKKAKLASKKRSEIYSEIVKRIDKGSLNIKNLMQSVGV